MHGIAKPTGWARPRARRARRVSRPGFRGSMLAESHGMSIAAHISTRGRPAQELGPRRLARAPCARIGLVLI